MKVDENVPRVYHRIRGEVEYRVGIGGEEIVGAQINGRNGPLLQLLTSAPGFRFPSIDSLAERNCNIQVAGETSPGEAFEWGD